MMTDFKKIYDDFETDEDKKNWRELVRRCANSGTIKVVFEKVDGTLRTLLGTTNFEKIPSEHHPVEGKERKFNKDELCNIFDIEAQGWRSFKYANVIEWEVVDTPLENNTSNASNS